MNATQNLYALGLNESAHLIATIGHIRTVILEGHIGTGKTSVEKILSELKPNQRNTKLIRTGPERISTFDRYHRAHTHRDPRRSHRYR